MVDAKAETPISDSAWGRIDQVRQRHGWTLYRLSQESGIPVGTLNSLDARGSVPTLRTLERLARCLGVPLGMILCESSDELAQLWDQMDTDQRRRVVHYARNLSA